MQPLIIQSLETNIFRRQNHGVVSQLIHTDILNTQCQVGMVRILEYKSLGEINGMHIPGNGEFL